MEANLDDKESLLARIQQLEHVVQLPLSETGALLPSLPEFNRLDYLSQSVLFPASTEGNELRKDIEQLCVQQAGPSYLVVATKMHFQRTASLEQEIEILKKKLSACTNENVNLQEELSEAYRIKTQLADLHRVEASKNMEAEKQVKFFQGCVANAFAERDQSIMEAEKAREKEEFMSRKYNEMQKRLEEVNSDCVEQKRQNDELRLELVKQEEENESFKKVINKFYGIRHQSLKVLEDTNWEDKCACLLHDSDEKWNYNDDSVLKYISSLEAKLETTRISVDRLQSRLRMGLEIENHLKTRVRELEKKQTLMDKRILSAVAGMRRDHSELKINVTNLLNEGKSHVNIVTAMVEEKAGQSFPRKEENCDPSFKVKFDECNYRDVHISTDAIPALESKERDHCTPLTMVDKEGYMSQALAQAMQEKVSALLLLSQQDERHCLEKNVNAALQKKIEELHRNFLQVTNEKVKALMELAQLKQDYKQLQKRLGNQANVSSDSRVNVPFNRDRDGRLRNLLKRTYLSRWVGVLDNATETATISDRSFSSPKGWNIDFASLKIENATLKESMESMEHLTSTIHRLRLALLKAKESVMHGGTIEGEEILDEIISEAKLVKIALGSSLPISWSAEGDDVLIDENIRSEADDAYGEVNNEKLDHVSAAGFEMVDLLIVAAQLLKDNSSSKGSL